MTGHVQQCVDLENGHALRPGRDLRDLVASLHLAFLKHTEVEARPTVLDHQRGHVRLIHAYSKPVTSDARLGHLEKGAADPVSVPYTDLCVRQSVDGEILSELSVDEVASVQLALPIP